MSYSEKIQDVLENSDVALFMKGTPDAIMCGNSERALGALRRAGAPITAVDILVDGQIREDPSAISGWPTIPQVFVKGSSAAPTSSRSWSARASSSRRSSRSSARTTGTRAAREPSR